MTPPINRPPLPHPPSLLLALALPHYHHQQQQPRSSSSRPFSTKKRGRPQVQRPHEAAVEDALDEEEAAVEELLRKDARRRRERADSVSDAMLAGREGG